MAGSLTGSHNMKTFHFKRSKFGFILTMLCILFSGCTAHTINSKVNIGICVKAL